MVVATSPPVVEVDTLEVRRGYSLDDYRRFEAESVERHEYRDGEVVTMTGGSEAHNTITVNLVVLLGFCCEIVRCGCIAVIYGCGFLNTIAPPILM